MSYMPASEVVEEYRELVRPTFEAWGLRNVQVDEKGKAVGMTYGAFTDDDLKKMLSDREYYDKNYERMMQELRLTRDFLKNGFAAGKPWFDGELAEKGMPPKNSSGLALMYMTVENTRNGQMQVYKPHNYANTKSWVYVTDDAIRTGFSEEEMKNPGLLASIGYLARAYKEVPDDSLLAAQQLAIQKWGKIHLSSKNGSDSLYIRRNLEIAVKNGTWQNITNPELQGRISAMVRNEANVDNIWKRFSDVPLSQNLSAKDLDLTLFNAVDSMAQVMKRGLADGTLRMSEEQRDNIKGLLASLDEFDAHMPGDFLNKIVASQRGNTVLDFNVLLKGAFEVMANNPALSEQIRLEINERAAARNALAGEITDGATDETAVDAEAENASDTTGVKSNLAPMNELTGLNKNSAYQVQESANLRATDESLPPETRSANAALAVEMGNIPSLPEPQANHLLAVNGLKFATLVRAAGVEVPSPAPNFRTSPQSENWERYNLRSMPSLRNFDGMVFSPAYSNLSYKCEFMRVPAPDGKTYDTLAITQAGDTEPSYLMVKDERTNSIALGCSTHLSADNSRMFDVLEGFRTQAEENRFMDKKTLEMERLLTDRQKAVSVLPKGAPENPEEQKEREEHKAALRM